MVSGLHSQIEALRERTIALSRKMVGQPRMITTRSQIIGRNGSLSRKEQTLVEIRRTEKSPARW
jgi:hypothetical protein